MTAGVDHIYRITTPHTEQKVTETGAQDHTQAQPRVVSHEDEHEQIAHSQLHHVKNGLQHMRPID
jgi:hypothetical protein